MALTFYGSVRSRASMPRWYLEEKGIPYTWQLLDLEAGEHRQAPFTSINPFGKVPALVDGSAQLFESGTILLYLAERYGVECQSVAERGLAQQWMLFANSTQATAVFVPSNREREFPRLMEVFDRKLGEGPLMGNQWNVADCAWQPMIPESSRSKVCSDGWASSGCASAIVRARARAARCIEWFTS